VPTICFKEVKKQPQKLQIIVEDGRKTSAFASIPCIDVAVLRHNQNDHACAANILLSE
jgi:hypothetical protein